MRPIRPPKQRGAARTIAATGVVLGLIAALATIVVQGRVVTAAPVSLTLNYNCTFPLIGAQPLSVTVVPGQYVNVQINYDTGIR